MRYKDIVCYLIPVAMAASCTYGNRGNVQLPAEDTMDMPLLAEDMLVSNEEIEAEGAFDKRGDELFDDFLYSRLCIANTAYCLSIEGIPCRWY